MKYQTGRVGRVVVARFDDGDDVLKGIGDISKKRTSAPEWSTWWEA